MAKNGEWCRTDRTRPDKGVDGDNTEPKGRPVLSQKTEKIFKIVSKECEKGKERGGEAKEGREGGRKDRIGGGICLAVCVLGIGEEGKKSERAKEQKSPKPKNPS